VSKFLEIEPVITKKKLYLSMLFVPGVYLMILLSTILTITIGCGIIFILYFLINKLLGGIGFAIFGVYLLIALPSFGIFIGIISCLMAIISTLFKKKTFEPAIIINSNEHPKLHQLILSLSSQMSAKMPDSIILHMKSNFFVSNGKIRVFNGVAKGRILSISLPLLSIFTVNELRAILAHEFAHFTGRDLIFSRIVLPVYKGAATYLEYMTSIFKYQGYDIGIISLPMLLPNFLMKQYLKMFHKFNMQLSRIREHRADFIASSICGHESCSEALGKVVSYGNYFDPLIDEEMSEKIIHGFEFTNYFKHFREYLDKYSKYVEETYFEALIEDEDKYSTHPTLLKRMSSIPYIEEKYFDEEQSIELLSDFDGLEINMTQQYNYFIYNHLAGSSFMYE